MPDFYSSFKYRVGLDLWALKICQETLIAVIAIRLRKDNSSGSADTLDPGAITLNKLSVSHHETGRPKRMANPMAYENSLLIRNTILPNPARKYFPHANAIFHLSTQYQ